jgi:four helix bundle protein
MAVHNFKKLDVWKKARELVKEIYIMSAKFPSEERFGIVSQIRRAAVSISLNISEGSGRGTDKDFSRFLDMSYSSALEVENLIYLCYDLGFIDIKKQDEMLGKVSEVQKMLRGFQSKLDKGNL